MTRQQFDDTKPVSFHHLQSLKLKPPKMLVDDFLVEGATILSGRPKFGKSFMCLSMCASIARGERVFGYFNVSRPANTLYIALEDSPFRVNDRLAKMSVAAKMFPENAYLWLNVPTLGEGGLSTIGDFVDKEEIELVVIDTIGRFTMGRKRSSQVYSDDYEVSSQIQEFAISRGISVVCIHHNRKGQDNAHFSDKVSGSYGTIGGYDTVIVVDRDAANLPKIEITSRDIKEASYAAKFNPKTYHWLVEGGELERGISKDKLQILETVAKYNQKLEVSALWELCRTDGDSWGAFRKRVQRLVSDGQLMRDGAGRLLNPESIVTS